MRFLKYFIVFVLVFASCKSGKTVTSNGVIVRSLSAKKVAKKHNSVAFDKEGFDARLKVHYKDAKENIGFSVRMKLLKDKVIWLKGTKIISVFKAKITPTKVSFYSPLKRNYFEGDFKVLSKLLGVEVNFEQLQNLLLGQSVYDLTKERQNVAVVNGEYQLSPKKQNELFELLFNINPKHFKLSSQEIIDPSKEQRLTINYSKYSNKNKVLFPEKVVLQGKTKKQTTKINLTYRSVEFTDKLNVDFKIPSGYKEIVL